MFGADSPSTTRNEPFHPGLAKKLILSRGDKEAPKRVSNEALLAAGELLRTFVKEARYRASIEAECEEEGSATIASQGSNDKTTIRADHITKVAAELLMDFS